MGMIKKLQKTGKISLTKNIEEIPYKNIIAGDILSLIGNTPLVRISRLNQDPELEIYAKLEGQNPGGSIKDRIAMQMIEQAEKQGRLRKGMTIIEPTSGNTGIGLAMIGAIKGYDVLIVMSSAVSVERRKMIGAFGAGIILTDASHGTDGAIIRAREIAAADPAKYFMPDQFSNMHNYIAHYEKTAEEIWSQTGGDIDYFVSALGTSGTLMGVGLNLKQKNPDIKIVSAHPVKGHYIQGLKNMEEAIVPTIYDPSRIDITVMVETEDAFDMTRRIARQEGIFAGMSSGAALWAALKLADEGAKGRMVVIFPDRGEKYLSTTLFG